MNMTKNNPDAHLLHLYKNLGDTSADFRNKNMYWLLAHMVKGKTLLDIGSGATHFMNTVSKMKRIKVEGIEPNSDLIKLGKQLYGNIGHVYPLEAENLNRIKGTYDTISMIDVLEHIEDDKKILLSIKNRLEPDGRLLILVPAYQFLYSIRDKNLGHFRRYSAAQLKNVLHKTGYSVESVRHWNIIGFFIYLFFEKMLKKSAPHNLRVTNKKAGFLSRFFHTLIDMWVKHVENRFDLGFGLSLIIMAKKNN